MAVRIPFEAALDSRSASAVADRVERIFADAGRDAGQQFSRGFGATSQGVDGDLKKIGDKASDAYDRARDAAAKLRAEEEKLQDLRDRGARNSQIVAQAGRAETARRAEVRAIRDATDAISDYERATQSASRGLRTSMAGAGSELRAGLRAGITDAAADFTAQFGVMGGVASNAFSGISAGAAGAALGIAGIGAAGVLAGKQLYDLGATWDNVADGISLRTGKMGSELDYLVGTVKDLSSITAAPLETIGDVAGQVSQNLSGLNSSELQSMVKTLSEFQTMGGEAVDIRGFGNVLDLFGVGPAGAMSALDSLYNASVDTGTSVNQLISVMGNAGTAAKQFGLGFGETAGLLTTMEEAGLDFTKVAPSLSVALKNIARDNSDIEQGFRNTIVEIRNFIAAGNEQQAVLLAQETFGRGYKDFFEVIKSGKLDVDSLSKALDDNKTSLNDVLEGTKDWSEEWQQLKNNMASAFAPAAEFVFGQVNHQLEQAGTAMSGFSDWVTGAGHAWQEFAALVSGNPLKVNVVTGAQVLGPDGKPMSVPGPAAGANPFAGQGGATGGGPGSLAEALGLGGGPASTTPALPLPGIRPNPWGQVSGGDNTYKDWYQSDDKPGGADKMPEAPSLPLQYTNTAGLPTAVANAQVRLDEAAHASAEKQARLNQLKASNVATEADIQRASNDVTKAEQDRMQAEQALNDSRIKATEQQAKQTEKLAGDMTEFGNKLDADFGISGGLGGIVENFVKAAGNILAAPFLQALGMIEKANPNEGSGLTGILAANGAFGSQYTPAAIAAATQQGTQQGFTAALSYGGGAAYAGVPIGSNMDVTNQSGLALLSAMGLKGTTYAGHTTDGASTDREVDVTDPVGGFGSAKMTAFAQFARQNPGLFEEFIYSDPTTGQKTGIRSGQLVGPGTSQPGYYAKNWDGHQDHAHVEPAKGGGLGFSGGADQASGALTNLAGAAQQATGALAGGNWNADWNAIAQAESGGNWGINTGNGYYGGLQFSPSSWEAAGGTQYAPSANLASPYQQALTAEQLLAMQGPGAWPNTFVPGSTGPAPTGAPGLAGVPPMAGGGLPGMGMPQSPNLGGGLPGIGNSIGQAAAGVSPGAAYPSQGGNSGNIMGGLALDGAMAATAGLDMMMPGAGAAAKIGIQLANRTIGYAAQNAGILASGALETFSLGDNPKGSLGAGWIGKLAGGIAGAAPALPNMAGKAAPAPGNGQGSTGQPAQAGGNTTNQTVNVTNNQANENQNGGVVAEHLSAMQAPAGRQ